MSDSFTRRNSADEDKKLDADEFVDATLGTVYRTRTLTIAEPFALRLDYDGNGNLIYYGKAATGSLSSVSVWQIRKLSYSGTGNLLDVLWPNGAKTFNYIWDNRVALSYS